MKKTFAAALIGVILSLLLLGVPVFAASKSEVRPSISCSPSVLPLDKKANVIILGSGFQPGQEVLILFHDALGVLTALPEPAVANERGSWATVWEMSDYVGKKIITDGVYSIMAADAKYNVLATTTAGFVDVSKDAKDWPDWAKAAGLKKPEGKPKEGKEEKKKKGN